MKNFSNILATVLVALFLLSFGIKSEAVGQPCTNMKDTLIIDGCPYEVDLCVYCGLTYPGYVKVNQVKQLTNCASPLDPNELLQQAFTQLSVSPYFWFNYCNPTLPPCPNKKKLNFHINVCWKIILYYHDGTSGSEEYIYEPCSDEYCDVEIGYCRDAEGNLVSEISNVDNTHSGTISCKIEGSVIVKPDYTNPFGTETQCYILHTPCNPDDFIW